MVGQFSAVLALRAPDWRSCNFADADYKGCDHPFRQRERALFVFHRRTKIPHFRLGRGQSIKNHWTAMLETLAGPARILHGTLAIAHTAVGASGQQPRVVVVGENIVFIERDCFLQINSRRVIGTIQRLGGGAVDSQF